MVYSEFISGFSRCFVRIASLGQLFSGDLWKNEKWRIFDLVWQCWRSSILENVDDRISRCIREELGEVIKSTK